MRLSLLLAACLLFASCAVLRRTPSVTRENAGVQLDAAQAEIERGELHEALERLIAVREAEGLTPEDRSRTEGLIERCADGILAELSGDDFDSGDLFDLYRLDLPPRLKARAGVLAAARMLEEGRLVKCFKTIRRVERALPSHAERAMAGNVLARCGMALAERPGRYYLLFRYRSRAIEALEFLVLHYPFDPSCPAAYATLARLYEQRGNLDDAIERLEDLIIYHPDAPLAVEAAAQLPYVRLERLQRDDYDRAELLRARDELDLWLERHAGHELEGWVREVGANCDVRLARSDLILARFYDRIDSPFGQGLHAERALRVAERAEVAEESEEARRLLREAEAESAQLEAVPEAEAP